MNGIVDQQEEKSNKESIKEPKVMQQGKYEGKYECDIFISCAIDDSDVSLVKSSSQDEKIFLYNDGFESWTCFSLGCNR